MAKSPSTGFRKYGRTFPVVTAANVGVQADWIPASAGMTVIADRAEVSTGFRDSILEKVYQVQDFISTVAGLVEGGECFAASVPAMTSPKVVIAGEAKQSPRPGESAAALMKSALTALP